MISSVSGNGAASQLAAALQQQSTRQDIDTAVLQKAQSNQKLQGEEAIKLIDSAAKSSSTGKLDVYA